MSQRNIITLSDVSLVTCMVQRKLADDVIRSAQDVGAQGATVHFAHGVGAHELLGILSVAVDVEKEVINILVPDGEIDQVFESMFLAGKLDTPGMGYIYVTKLEKAATYVHPEVLAELGIKT
ncbi:nitrogen regulatory protein P-II [Mariprofundus micogutta]|uniref:Nitrogen regulatory protein P-II n=1 Tax=Mariprofundus micogutta TaxID=1921010 RepID=A0A1L8CNJ8_9PROT|nr:P-II family nitrogen regulator [Mariprofundus micogutta]GAV20488.1 nitrogen regulatory protein P-II [Mariprofundus micogutta]